MSLGIEGKPAGGEDRRGKGGEYDPSTQHTHVETS